MAKKKAKKILIPKALLLPLIITGIATLILQILNRRLKLPELGEIMGYVGTVFVISLIIMIGILLVNQVNKK